MSLLNKSIVSAVLATAVLGVAAQSAHAAFVYDLRFAPGQGATVSSDLTTADITGVAAGTTYAVQLWGQITGDTNLTNDAYLSGYYGIKTAGGGASGAITTGGISTATAGSLTGHAGFNAGSTYAGTDGLTDLGSTATNSLSNWAVWNAGTTGVAYASGTAVTGQSQAVAATNNAWEILLGTYTITVGGVGAQGATTKTTTFTPNSALKAVVSITTTSLLNITQDGVVQTGKGTGTGLSTLATPIGVTFQVDAAPQGAIASLFNASQATYPQSSVINTTTSSAALTVTWKGDGYYGSPILELNKTLGTANKGSINIAGAGSQNFTTDVLNPKFVMLWVDSADEAAIYSQLATLAGSNGLVSVEDSSHLTGGASDQWATLQSGFVDNNNPANTETSGKSFNILLKYSGATQALNNFSWDFSKVGSGAVLEAIAIVPEPATLGLLALGAMGLLSRKRK